MEGTGLRLVLAREYMEERMPQRDWKAWKEVYGHQVSS
jgi:hypothetical protein